MTDKTTVEKAVEKNNAMQQDVAAIADMKKDVETLDRDLSSTRSKVSTLESRVETLAIELADAKDKIKSFSDNVAAAFEDIQKDIANLTRGINTVQSADTGIPEGYALRLKEIVDRHHGGPVVLPEPEPAVLMVVENG